MVADFNLKVGDLEPALSIQLLDESGNPVDVTTAMSITFRMAPVLTRVELFARSATVDNPITGQFSYIWQPGDTDLAGTFYAEFAVEWPPNRTQTYPYDGYMTVTIEPRL